MTTRRFTLRLPDGRDLDVFDNGPQDGPVLLFQHGTPGSGVSIRAIDTAAHRLGLRVVTASRPGYGNSTRAPGRQIVDVVGDSAAILDAVGAERCFVAGWSGGGPHALACGARLSSRVSAVVVIAGLAPYGSPDFDYLGGMGEGNLDEFGKILEGEAVLRPYLEEQCAHLRQVTATDWIQAFSSVLPASDRAVLTATFAEDLTAEIQEGIRDSIDGWLDDSLAFVAPWGFSLTEIAVPTAVWQGAQDLMVPVGHGAWLAEHIPGAVAHLETGEGHLSIAIGAIDRMLQELVAPH